MMCMLSTCCLSMMITTGKMVQVIYVLEVATAAMCCIMLNLGMAFRRLAWSHDSQAIIVPCLDASSFTRQYHVYSRSGEHILQFSEAGVSKGLPHMASTMYHRLVTTHTHGIKIWDLAGGQVLGDETLHTGCTGYNSGCEGLLASNMSGSRVAWGNPSTYELHVFDAASLRCLSIIHTAYSLRPIQGILHLRATVDGWLIVTSNSLEAGSYTSFTYSLNALTTVPSYQQQVLWRQDVHRDCYPGVSPCGRYVCVHKSESQHIILTVYDARSGQELLTQAVGELVGVQDADMRQNTIDVWWSDCATRLLASSMQSSKHQERSGTRSVAVLQL